MRIVSVSRSHWCRWVPRFSCIANASDRCHAVSSSAITSIPRLFRTDPLTGRDIDVPDLRGGFSHLIAALAAKGPSNVQGISLIDRGYADFRGKLEALGADFD